MGYGPILLANASGQVQQQLKWTEAATQTFKQGVPLRLSGGHLTMADTADPWGAADVVVGVSSERAHNLTAAGTAEPAYSEGAPAQQASAKTIPVGAWMKDGKIAFYPANGVNVFLISLLTGQVYAETLKVAGTYYTLKHDAGTGFFYLDPTDTAGNNAVAEIVGGVSDDTTKVLFRFKAGQRFFD